ncbi:MAG: hypothetical protein F4X01_00715 [Nitrospira sp. SB0661_bin_20]|nr:hypothetical protein [Nitrospira sp. SB0661_bin_20]MYJ23115.1 hypothetical protein [Nitrospira sp. SB0673_bin_12]
MTSRRATSRRADEQTSASQGTRPNWENRTLFHGDNLLFLRAMNSESVDLIATDPPFNKGRDFHATPDSLADGASFQDRWSWDKDVHQDWVDKITDDFPKVMNVIQGSRNSYGDDMGAFLCFMAVRLLEMRRVLKPTGSLYLHCDPTASHYLKELLDAIFGRKQFKDEIVWRRNESGAKGSQHSAKRWGNNVDHLLFYVKEQHAKFEPRIIRDLTQSDIVRMFPKVDKDGRRYNLKMTAWRSPSMGARPNLCYEFHGCYPPYPSGWRLGKKRMEEEYQKGNIVVLEDKLERRSYVKDYLGVSPGNLWSDTFLLLGAQSKERTGYPTQKPLALYERIIKASSNEGDVVLDPFAGCATTCVAAERLNRQWVGIDIWAKARTLVVERLQQEGLADSSGDTRGKLFTSGQITYATTSPVRTDDGQEAVPFLKTKLKVDEPKGPKMSRADMVTYLLDQHGNQCQGCYRVFDDARYLELDHNTPRSDGGLNHISNRVLLCGPCNKLKRNLLTLSGLRRENKKLGYMKGS